MTLGPTGEATVRAAITVGDGQVPASGLLDRLGRAGLRRSTAISLVLRATGAGLLLRSGNAGRYHYQLNPRYDRTARYEELPAAVRAPSDGLRMPAFGSAPLAPHLGTPVGDDDELPPVVGYAYRDTTRRIFDRAFREPV